MSSEYLLANKPAGLLTHGDGHDTGFVEFLSQKTGMPLKVVHRLDRDTTGAMVFAKTSAAASELTELFTHRRVDKKYLFLTDRPCRQDSFEHSSFIERHKGRWTSSKSDSPNSFTQFQKISEHENYSLWQASPETGKTHQIRLHAQDLSLSILGDSQYGGSPFPQILLHCSQISFFGDIHAVETPILFENLDLLKDHELCRWLCEYDRRKRVFPEQIKFKNQCLRIIDQKEKGWACDKYGEVLWFYHYKPTPIKKSEEDRIRLFSEKIKASEVLVRQMKNRGSAPQLQQDIEAKTWQAAEGDIRYQLSSERGWSPGLFLDQRQNREWVRRNAHGKSVLNLFCYTAGFSIAAALGGASPVASVDTSSTTLQWAKENFSINGLNPEDFEFWSADARDFLSGCQRRRRKFDLIVCDPPSFARNKKGVFRIEDEAEQLVRSMLACLQDRGVLLFSSNYEKWTEDDLRSLLTEWSSGFRVESAPGKGLEFGAENAMKSFFISRDGPSPPS